MSLPEVTATLTRNMLSKCVNVNARLFQSAHVHLYDLLLLGLLICGIADADFHIIYVSFGSITHLLFSKDIMSQRISFLNVNSLHLSNF